ncbi:helix-turn-helix domain-containing protein, partial [Micromonospora carbonacea]|uniref:PucR family transcriptional regulator n=1 Tax=Micromonospora carbonacea TaxID=47853 RepID=UPI0033CB790C
SVSGSMEGTLGCLKTLGKRIIDLGNRGGSWADPGPVFVDDHLVALTLRGEAGALAVLAARRLAPLAHLRPAQRESLLVTLHSWLRHWGSRAEVASELYVHPQTVSYRIRRLRELYGDDLTDPTARTELLLVLAARPTPGSAPGHGSAPGPAR